MNCEHSSCINISGPALPKSVETVSRHTFYLVSEKHKQILNRSSRIVPPTPGIKRKHRSVQRNIILLKEMSIILTFEVKFHSTEVHSSQLAINWCWRLKGSEKVSSMTHLIPSTLREIKTLPFTFCPLWQRQFPFTTGFYLKTALRPHQNAIISVSSNNFLSKHSIFWSTELVDLSQVFACFFLGCLQATLAHFVVVFISSSRLSMQSI